MLQFHDTIPSGDEDGDKIVRAPGQDVRAHGNDEHVIRYFIWCQVKPYYIADLYNLLRRIRSA